MSRTAILMDVHTHSNFSLDGADSPQRMAARAKELGLGVWALTDHCEVNEDEQGYRRRSWESARELIRLRQSGAAQGVTLLAGIELGQATQNPDFAKTVLEGARYDFVIGSLHNNAGRADFYSLDYAACDRSPQELLEDYYKEVLQMVRLGDLDVLGHLTYPLRYMVGEHGLPVRMEPFDDLIDEIFKALIHAGKGIEVNTSGLRQKIGETMPGRKYLARYRELGGQIVTVGSDSHCTGDLGKGVPQAYALLEDCGFSYAAYFENRLPRFVKL